jgi:transmembrane sensor
MDHQQLKAIIDRYLEGRATAAEQAFIEEWLSDAEQADAGLTGEEWETLRTDMLTHIRQEAGYEAPAPSRKARLIPRLLPAFKRVAAMLLLVVGVYALFRYLRSLSVPAPVRVATIPAKPPLIQYRTVASGKKGIERVVLPDSSVVMLNRSSRLRFPEQFGSGERTVYLEEGEAFFDVHTDADHPFIVYARKIKTKVLGTSFNIRAYGRSGKVSVVVRTGRVKVTPPATTANWADYKDILLQPDEALELDTLSYKGRTFPQPAQLVTAWCAPKLTFNQNTLPEIIQALENKFGVQITLTSAALEQCRYTASFEAQYTLQDILEALCLVHQLQYTRKGNRIEIYGEACR